MFTYPCRTWFFHNAHAQYEKTRIVWKKEGNNDGHVLMGCRKGWEAKRTTDPGSEVKTHFIQHFIISRWPSWI